MRADHSRSRAGRPPARGPTALWATGGHSTVWIATLPGVHDLYFVFGISPNIPEIDVSDMYGAVAGWLDLGVN